jgi:dTDP-4-amino-4,6-dideoxygalactose transaminase
MQTREALQANLLQQGVNTMIHYPIPPHLQPAYAELNYKQGNFPIAELIHREVLSLPIGPHMTSGQQLQVIRRINAWRS